jgi:desulfoferrodoxin (superoxide reductase-like protein)
MKRIFLIFLFSLSFLIGPGYAHPPSRISVDFNPDMTRLTLFIVHPVEYPDSHFIERVIVSVNGKVAVDKRLSKQDDAMAQFLDVELKDLKANDVITIQAFCSVNGSLKREITVEE